MLIVDAEFYHLPEIEKLFGSYFYMPQVFMNEGNIGWCLVALVDGKVVGALKIRKPNDSDFESWELQFCAVDKDYQRQGIAEELIRRAVGSLEGDVYASAWRTWDNPERAHIHNVLTKIGFVLEDQGYKHWTAKHFCKYGQCAYVNLCDKSKCECWEDMYVLYRS